MTAVFVEHLTESSFSGVASTVDMVSEENPALIVIAFMISAITDLSDYDPDFLRDRWHFSMLDIIQMNSIVLMEKPRVRLRFTCDGYRGQTGVRRM